MYKQSRIYVFGKRRLKNRNEPVGTVRVICPRASYFWIKKLKEQTNKNRESCGRSIEKEP